MSITVIPTAFAQRAVAANPRNAGTCGLFDVAGRLGQADRSIGYLCRTVDTLIAHEDFPAPFPLVRAGSVVKTAHKDSRWPLVAIDAWFHDRLPRRPRPRRPGRARRDRQPPDHPRARALLGDAA